MKRTLTLALAISLLASISIYADGNQGTGNRVNDCLDPNNCPPAECTQGCPPSAGMNMEEDTDSSALGEAEELFIEAVLETVELILF